MEDKRSIEILLRAFSNKDIKFDYTVDFILSIFSNSKRFNSNNFLAGIFIGGIIYMVIMNWLI